MKDDQYFLSLATDEGNNNPKPYNFGAVIVKDVKVIAQDHNHVHKKHDPSAHAEVSALRQAALAQNNHNIDGCIMYGSHEPCLMCFCCAAWANVARVVYAVPASELSSDSYEFIGVNLKDLAKKLVNPIQVDLVPLLK